MIEKKATLRGFVERLTKKPRRNQKELTIDRSRMLHRTTLHVSDFSVEQKNVMTDQRKCMDPTTYWRWLPCWMKTVICRTLQIFKK